mmetsp:Transcript_25554/g.101869  ORF Transcript_25554/g.101869 Transcript_25554/m.101869 type:complete len:297 (+) Transcript_25554:1480-2370(+)
MDTGRQAGCKESTRTARSAKEKSHDTNSRGERSFPPASTPLQTHATRPTEDIVKNRGPQKEVAACYTTLEEEEEEEDLSHTRHLRLSDLSQSEATTSPGSLKVEVRGSLRAESGGGGFRSVRGRRGPSTDMSRKRRQILTLTNHEDAVPAPRSGSHCASGSSSVKVASGTSTSPRKVSVGARPNDASSAFEPRWYTQMCTACGGPRVGSRCRSRNRSRSAGLCGSSDEIVDKEPRGAPRGVLPLTPPASLTAPSASSSSCVADDEAPSGMPSDAVVASGGSASSGSAKRKATPTPQ